MDNDTVQVIRVNFKTKQKDGYPSHKSRPIWKEQTESRPTNIPLILNLGNRWRWVVSFTTRPLYPRERTPVPTEWEAVKARESLWIF